MFSLTPEQERYVQVGLAGLLVILLIFGFFAFSNADKPATEQPPPAPASLQDVPSQGNDVNYASNTTASTLTGVVG